MLIQTVKQGFLLMCMCMASMLLRAGHATARNGHTRVLAVGDSLTEGYFSGVAREGGVLGTTTFHPYARTLQELARKAGLEVEVVEEGVSGELVVPTMHDRLAGLLGAAHAAGAPYDWVLVLGGINDVGWGRDADTIFTGLSGMYKAARNHGARVVAMTCFEYNRQPGLHAPPPAMEAQRAALNAHIRAYAQDASHGVALLDTEALMKPGGRGGTTHDGRSMWCDLLHLTPAGYAHLGALIWARVLAPALGAKVEAAPAAAAAAGGQGAAL
mmetsp:Transcript_20818/g.52932  ORF Transcript_20818/g.52932 Transcript_20818/m.52932 type:complete len:271 (-) Transcript_20818:779-1591(-)